MATVMLLSIDEYLRTGYDPDVEFVDGVLKERAAAFSTHGLLQALLGVQVMHREEWGVKAAFGVRTRVALDCHRDHLPKR